MDAKDTDIFELQIFSAEIVIHGEQLVVCQFVADFSVVVLRDPVALHLRAHP
jgi:hypothetical protein